MAALTANRNTIQMGDRVHPDLFYLPLAANAKVFQGALVAISTASGYAGPATTATTWIIFGRAEVAVDNTGGANGAKFVTVRRGVFKWNTPDIVQANLGGVAYANDDNTVSNVSTGKSVAGKIVGIDTDGVWVETFGAITNF